MAKKNRFATMTVDEIRADRGWNDDTMRELVAQFLGEEGLTAAYTRWLARLARDEETREGELE